MAENINQLEKALHQIDLNERDADRIAFILIDNAIELMLHEYAKEKEKRYRIEYLENREYLDFCLENNIESDNRLFKSCISKDKKLKKLWERSKGGMGRAFDQKVRASCKFGLINDELKDSIISLHEFRNTAYHLGLRHDGILHGLAVLYLECACIVVQNLFPKVDKMPWEVDELWGLLDSDSPITNELDAYTQVSELLQAARSKPHTLVHDLVDDMESMINKSDSLLKSQSLSQEVTRDQALVESQIWPIIFSDKVKDAFHNSGITDQSLGSLVEWVSENFHELTEKHLMSLDPIVGWKNRLNSLRQEKNRHTALKKYCDFVKQTTDLRKNIEDRSRQLADIELKAEQMLEAYEDERRLEERLDDSNF